MNECEISSRWDADRPIYEAWANFVTNEICEAIRAAIIPQQLGNFLKIPAEPRLKETRSLVDKALFRQKNYNDPYADITDKVGVRFVVLLTSDIKKVEQAICSGSDKWIFSKDRDYEEERQRKPLEFAYQSVHYVVSPPHETIVNGVTIPESVSCEVQVRTLLQHAHSELTHDSIYKPKRTASVEIQRTVAKSMALIETTDEFFERVIEDLHTASEPERGALILLRDYYIQYIKREPENQKSNLLIIDAFLDKIENLGEKLKDLFHNKPFIVQNVADRAAIQHLYRQPSIILAYLMAATSPAVTKERWPLTLDELRPVYQDLGLSLDNY